MSTPRIAAVHDLSCFGRCSLTIALPVLSAMGCQCCPLPTALLSAHTAIPGFTLLDTTAEMGRIAEHWSAMDLQFQAIYSGFLGSPAQVALVDRFIRRFHRADSLLVIDPVMGDHGKAYQTCTPELCGGIRKLAGQAEVITPNLTEAAILLEQPYEALQSADGADIVRQLSLNGRRSVVLTGYSAGAGLTGALCFDRADGQIHSVQTPREPRDFPGTGDLFTSVLTGALVHGMPLHQAAQTAADFVRACVARTIEQHLSEADGVDFEPLLGQLAR